jgi:hypothetical protein
MNANKSNVIHRRPYYTVKTGVMVDNISVISWWSDSLVEETEAPRENHRPVASHGQTLMSHRVHPAVNGIRTLVEIGTACIGSNKSKYHTITTTMTSC